MKKLMIAAAAAAMIGGAYATEYAYDYSATVKTTTGKAGTETFTVGPWNLGVNDDGDTFWYMDETVQNAYLSGDYTAYFTTKKISGSTVPCLTSTAKKDYDFLFNVLEINRLAGEYGNKHNNKWCETISKITWKESDCYRVATSKKITNVFYVEDCCQDYFESADGQKLEFILNNRFGALSKDKATKLEVVGYVNDFCIGTDADTFTLAGQGTWKEKLWKIATNTYLAGIYSISGNIVGVLEAPNCQACCTLEDKAIAWECDADEADANEDLPTAAFGTWTLKFNQKKSTSTL